MWGGGLVALLSGLYGLLVVVMRLFGNIEVPGFTVLALLLVFFGSLILFGLGVVGSYASRAYENTKARPHYLVASIEDHGPHTIEDHGPHTDEHAS